MTHWRVSLFALVLAAAGLPLYIHLPRYASVDLGLDLAAVGTIILAIRIFDFVTDPVIGVLIDRWHNYKKAIASVGALLLAAGFLFLFSIEPQFDRVLWLIIALILVFTGYSTCTILLYGESATLAGSALPKDQLRLSAWRESGLLAGVIIAAIAPYLLPGGFGGFGWLVAGLAIFGCLATWEIWQPDPSPRDRFSLPRFISAGGGWLLAIATVNSLPVAITSTLFIFFVEDHLGLSGWTGAFLILFFAGAGLSAPVWSMLAQRFGSRSLLIAGVMLSIASFIWAAFLEPGNAFGFSVICVMSGIALGADMVILPALFAALLGRAGIAPGQGFGLWAFASKLALPIAAAIILPALQATGFVAGSSYGLSNTGGLVAFYAILPCVLKFVAGVVISALPASLFQQREPKKL